MRVVLAAIVAAIAITSAAEAVPQMDLARPLPASS